MGDFNNTFIMLTLLALCLKVLLNGACLYEKCVLILGKMKACRRPAKLKRQTPRRRMPSS